MFLLPDNQERWTQHGIAGNMFVLLCSVKSHTGVLKCEIVWWWWTALDFITIDILLRIITPSSFNHQPTSPNNTPLLSKLSIMPCYVFRNYRRKSNGFKCHIVKEYRLQKFWVRVGKNSQKSLGVLHPTFQLLFVRSFEMIELRRK